MASERVLNTGWIFVGPLSPRVFRPENCNYAIGMDHSIELNRICCFRLVRFYADYVSNCRIITSLFNWVHINLRKYLPTSQTNNNNNDTGISIFSSFKQRQCFISDVSSSIHCITWINKNTCTRPVSVHTCISSEGDFLEFTVIDFSLCKDGLGYRSNSYRRLSN